MPRSLALSLAVLLALASLCSAETDPWENDKDTLLLHADNFTEVISQHKLIMVEFFTPWCGHCRQFAPEYIKAATDLKKEGIQLAKINCDDEKNHPIAARYGVRGFPTIKIFKHMFDSEDPKLGTVESFDVERKYEHVVSHMRDLGLPPREVDAVALEDLALRTKNTPTEVSVLILGVFESNETPAYKAFAEAAFGKPDPPTFAWTSDRAAAERFLPEGYKHKEGVVVVTKFLDDDKGPYFAMHHDMIADPAAIVAHVDTYTSPLVWHYSNELSSQILASKLQKFVWAFVDKDTPHWETYSKALKATSKSMRGMMKFVLVEAQHAPLMQFFNIDKTKLPQILLIDLHPESGQRQFKYGTFDDKAKEWDTSSAKDLTTASLTAFIGKYQAGTLKRFLRSEKVPQTNDGPVLQVVGHTFEETIRSGKDVLLEMYGDYSWCEHCKVYEPEWSLIARTFADASDHLTVARMNFGHNDIEDAKPRGIQPKGFPEILLFRAGEHDQAPIVFDPEKYGGERGLKAVTKFVQEYASKKFKVGGTHFGGKKREEL